jgi:hypothetical protein
MSVVMSLSLLLGKLRIALSPMNGACSFLVGFDTMDVDCISDGANTKTYSSICIDFQYYVRPTKGRLILVLHTLAQHDLVVDVIVMWDLRFVLDFVFLLNQTLLLCVRMYSQFIVC